MEPATRPRTSTITASTEPSSSAASPTIRRSTFTSPQARPCSWISPRPSMPPLMTRSEPSTEAVTWFGRRGWLGVFWLRSGAGAGLGVGAGDGPPDVGPPAGGRAVSLIDLLNIVADLQKAVRILDPAVHPYLIM